MRVRAAIEAVHAVVERAAEGEPEGRCALRDRFAETDRRGLCFLVVPNLHCLEVFLSEFDSRAVYRELDRMNRNFLGRLLERELDGFLAGEYEGLKVGSQVELVAQRDDIIRESHAFL